MKKVLVISSSLRKNSNSEILAREFAKGAETAGHDVEFITLQDKKIAFCCGCLACQNRGACIIRDDANAITEKMKTAEVIAFATPIYYYEMSGQLKTMLDRANSLYSSDYQFREIYLLTTAADEDAAAMDRAASGLGGWIACFPKAQFKGAVFGCAGAAKKIMENKTALQEAYKLGLGS